MKQTICLTPPQEKIFLEASSFQLEQATVATVQPNSETKQLLVKAPFLQTRLQGFCSYLKEEKRAFMSPFYFNSLSQIPKNSYFLLFKQKKQYTAFFALSHPQFTTSFSGNEETELCLNLNSLSSEELTEPHPAFVCYHSSSLYRAIEQVMALALAHSGGLGKLVKEKQPLPTWIKSLGWESGHFGHEVSHAHILEAVQSVQSSGIQLKYVLIDEGWQEETNQRELISFHADKKRFPKGLKALVKELKKEGVEQVGVWHGIMGARGGIEKELAKQYALPQNEQGAAFLGTQLGQTFQFFYDYYLALREEGITFIKVGAQNDVGHFCPKQMHLPKLYSQLQSAMQAAASIQFNSAHFNTDCLRQENLFYWGASRIARAADDIDIKTSPGVMRTLRNNLTNALWLQQLMQPDFDTWMTRGVRAEMLAVFHALSGSLNTISDFPYKHNSKLLRKLALPSGKLLQADAPLTLCESTIFKDPLKEKQICKAFTTKGEWGVITAFNLSLTHCLLHDKVRPKEIPHLEGNSFGVFSYKKGCLGTIKRHEAITLTLKPHEWDIFTFAPLKKGVAIFGSYQYFLSPGILQGVSVEEESVHIVANISAPLVAYCEKKVLEIRRNEKEIPWEQNLNNGLLSIDERSAISETSAVYTILFE